MGSTIAAPPKRRRRGLFAGATSFRSPVYDRIEARLEEQYGLPAGLMSAIRTKGERSNADQVSPAGARSVYQIIPSTRDAFLEKYGVDAFASPENAARVAALHLRESLDRGADPVREYHGGTNPANWGPINDAYAGRVATAGFSFDGLAGLLSPVSPAKAATLPEGFDVVSLGEEKTPPAVPGKAGRIATIEQGVQAGDWTRQEADKLIADIEAEADPAPLVSTASYGRAFFDELPEEVRSKLSPQQVAAWQALARNPNSTPQQLEAFMNAQGYDLANAQEIVKARNEGAGVNEDIVYKPLDPISLGDGSVGAFARGVGDPFNVLDELGGVADAFGATLGRENIFNSDRSFGNLINSNIDINRAILAADDRDHFAARLGGQLATGVLLPIGAGARTPLQLAKLGGIEGAAAGFGAGEGGVVDRLPSTAAGAAFGTAGGFALGKGIEKGAPLLQRLVRGSGDEGAVVARQAAFEAAPVVNDGAQNAGPTPAARTQPQGGAVAAMADETEALTLTGPAGRVVDRIDVGRPIAGDDLPEGFQVVSLGNARPMGERVTAEEIADLARDVRPDDVTPLPANRVEDLDEFNRIGEPRRLLPAPDPSAELATRRIPSRNDLFKGSNRKGPLDLVAFLRRQGGLKDSGGDLAHMGIDNAPRKLDFARNEQFLGKLVDEENGLDLDEAALRAWEAGYFPQHAERPTIDEFLDALQATHSGASRSFLPDDLDEVQRFYAAQAERGRVKTAAQEDSPLVEDVGEVITLDDLRANEPPSSAYEEMPSIVGKVGNINLAKIEDPQDVARLIRQVQNKVGGFDEAKRGIVTNEETRRLAEEMGLTPEQLLKRRRGQALNAEEMYATRVLLQQSRQLVGKLAKRALGGSDEDVARFRNAWMRHVALEEQMTAATAEVGRAMQQFKMLAKAGDASDAAVKAYLRGGGGRETVEEAARKIVDLMEDPAAANRFMRDAAKARKRDMINEIWINSLLSGPRTHVVNAVSNLFTALYSLPEQALTAGIGKALGTQERATMREVSARAAGLVEGAREGLRLAKHAWVTGEPLDAVSKVEARNYQAIPGRLGSVIRTPTRALTASDEFFKSMNRRAALNAAAYRRTLKGNGTPAEKLQRFQELVNDPDELLRRQADEEARYYTFQKQLGAGGQAIQRFANEVPLAKFIIPFVRTPINLLKFAGERSVFAPLMKEFREAWKAGGNDRNQAMARVMLGSGLSLWAVSAALDGRISGGGPTDWREAAALRNSGWQPYSIRIGDEWVSYQRFEPLSLLIGAAADFAEAGNWATQKEADEIGMGLGLALAKNITSKTWLSGLSDFFEVLSDPERYGDRWVNRMAGSLAVPSIVAHGAGASDPYLREVNGMLDAIKNRIPVLSHDLAVRRDVWGEPIERGSGAGQGVASGAYNFLSPVYSSTASRDPVRREVARLQAPLSPPQRSIRVDGVNTRLTPEQYSYYVQLAGQPAKAYLDGLVGTPEWRGLTDDEKRDHLKAAMKDFRAAAREELRAMYPDLQSAPEGLPPGFEVLPEGFEVVQ